MTGSQMHKNVIDTIVGPDLCIGCGVCAAICPIECLMMSMDDHGAYRPVHGERKCPAKCCLCLQVCPFSDRGDNEDILASGLFAQVPGMQHKSETGFYLNCLVGYSQRPGQRWSGSSGGMVTWTLQALLRSRMVDFVVCVRPAPGESALFLFDIFSDEVAVQTASRSCYHPVEMSNIIRAIESVEGRFAVVGLPCFLKALRRAAKHRKFMRTRIAYMLGLVCGGMPSHHFTEFLCAMAGESPSPLHDILYRVKDRQRPANDFAMALTFQTNGETLIKRVYWSEGISKIWLEGTFKFTSCQYCDDIFAECADAAFADAWLPEYQSDSAGTSLVLLRNQKLVELLSRGKTDGELRVDPILVEDVIRSQSQVIENKRIRLAARVKAFQWSRSIPLKRFPNMPSGLVLVFRELVNEHFRFFARRVWARMPQPKSIEKYERSIFLPRLARKILFRFLRLLNC